MLLNPTKSSRIASQGLSNLKGIRTDGNRDYNTANKVYAEDGRIVDGQAFKARAGADRELKEDPAAIALRYAGIGVPAKAENGSSLTNGELAKQAFEAHGLTFDLMAQETYRLLEECEPTTKLQVVKFVNDVLTLDSEAKLKQLLEASKAPTINIQINNAFSEGSARTPLDILIPNLE